MTADVEPEPSERGDAADVAAPRSGTIQSVERAAQVLRVLAGWPEGASAQDVTTAVALDRTTVHRLLRTLVGTGLVERRGSGYCLGAACAQLGAGRLQSLGLREVALPFAVDLQHSFIRDRPAVVSISARALDEVVIIDLIWTPAVPLSIIMGIGWRFRIDATVSGRSMLSTLADEDIVQLLGAERCQAVLPQLEEVRARDGLEFGLGEYHAGVGTLACPILSAVARRRAR